MKIDLKETTHLVASLVVLTVAFAYPSTEPTMLAVIAISVGSGFIFHELGHKFTAQHFGYTAVYEASPMGLLLAIFLKITTGVVFAAPGAVMIQKRQSYYSNDDKYYDVLTQSQETWKIALAGPLINVALAVVFMGIMFLSDSALMQTMGLYGAYVNVFLAGFNMIPFGPLDGAKVFKHNPAMWGFVGLPLVLMFLIISGIL
ncbi:MAG TPA: site-2 protease family protein [Methanosarcinaceae archaeon]|nr:site-2 protease family protein [Methanosarcinaceae archaeon]